MSEPQWHSAVVPARLAFLAIYNPSLGLTDETFKEQLVYYYSRVAQDSHLATRKHARNDAAGGDARRAEENEKLRHIGLAQGMVDFARSFSNGQPVDSIDTDKSRIVLHELEKGWWILASIDLTRLPSMSQSSSTASKKGNEKEEPKPNIEYSPREVSPPALLLSQLIQAHSIFTLHHGPSLSELYIKHSRDKFCAILDRYWTQFSRSWDVLLHGNPATDIFGGLKLSSGGELGMGVGEEEWGSGERDVLEDLARRTEGLVDLLVSRFGEPAPLPEEAPPSESETVPWLGSGSLPLASDGVIFSGINVIARTSLRSLALWNRQIYTYGDYAYGVRDNPHRERRKRRRPHPPEQDRDSDPSQVYTPPLGTNGTYGTSKTTSETSAHDHEVESHKNDKLKRPCSPQGEEDSFVESDSANRAKEYRPDIPPPIVSAAHKSLDNATRRAESDAKHVEILPSGDSGTTMGIPDQYMKYLTLGLSTLAKPSTQYRPNMSQRSSGANARSTATSQNNVTTSKQKRGEPIALAANAETLSQLDALPRGQTLRDKIITQKRQEERGQFVIGLKGDLDDVPDDPEISFADVDDESGGVRNILRTLQIEVVPAATDDENEPELQRKLIDAGLPAARNDPLNFRRLRVLVYVHRPFMYCFLFEDRTPSLGMAHFFKTLHHSLEPIYKPLLASTSIERIAQRIEETQALVSGTLPDSASVTSTGKSQKTSEPKPIYDLMWDPALLTIHTSIPNIPEPGTPAAEGILPSTKDSRIPHAPDWTRVEALNVHSQILNTYASTQRNDHEYERTNKTSRGWWVVWLKLSPSTTRETAAGNEAESNQNIAKESGKDDAKDEANPPNAPESEESDETVHPSAQDSSASHSMKGLESTATTAKARRSTNRIVFLVRKATDATSPPKSDTTSRAVSSMWQTLSLRPASNADETTGGSRAGWGPAALAGGIGIDARKYAEGLLQLNR